MKRLTLLAVLLMLVATHAQAEFGGSRFVAISAADGRAVIKQADGTLRMVQVGDKVGDKPGEEAVVVGFDGDRVVLQRAGEWAPVTLYVGLENGEQLVWRMERRPL